jgi:C4-dicarboxylate-binding protein DctP
MVKKTNPQKSRSFLKKTSSFLLAGCLIVAFCSAANAAPKYTLKIGTLESPTGANTLGWKAFEQYVESNSGGAIEIDILPSSQLGDTEKLLEGLKLGIHKMAQGDESITGAYAPMMAWFTPYLFRDEFSMKQFFESPAFEDLNNQMAADLGVRALAAVPYGFYNFINKTRPIKTVADMKGLKLRTLPNSQITIKTWEALGAAATPVPWAEIYTSIKTGVIDGLGHTPGIMVDQKYYEVAKFVTLDNSMGVANLYLVNESFYKSLPDDLKGILKQGSLLGASVEFGIATYRNRVESMDALQANGVDIYTLTAAERQEFKRQAHEKVIPWLKEVSGAKNVDSVFAEVKRIESK